MTEVETELTNLKTDVRQVESGLKQVAADTARVDSAVTALTLQTTNLAQDVTNLKALITATGLAAKIIGVPSAVGILVLAGFFYNANKKIDDLETRAKTVDTQVTKLSTYSEDIRQRKDAALKAVDNEANISAKAAVALEMKTITDDQAISTKRFLAAGTCPAWAPKVSTVFLMMNPEVPRWARDPVGFQYGNAHFASADLCERR